jgi:hypothetical protein
VEEVLRDTFRDVRDFGKGISVGMFEEVGYLA